MQQTQKTIYSKCFMGITGAAWVTGLLIAGSDSPYMPWLNGIGLIVFLGASILMAKLFNPSNSNAPIHHGGYQKNRTNTMRLKKENRKINIPYALGI